MRNNLIILFAVLLSACAHTEPTINTVIQKEKVPYEVPCKQKIPAKPDFNFNKLAVGDTMFEKSQASLADRELHLGYETELLAALTACIK